MKHWYYFFCLLLAMQTQAQSIVESQEIAGNEASGMTPFLYNDFSRGVTNTGYDVDSYRLQIDLAADLATYTASTTIGFTTERELSNFLIDAGANLIITSVELNGQAIPTYNHLADVLDVSLPNPIPINTNAEILVNYTVNANNSAGYFLDTHGSNVPLAFTLSEPYTGPTWWVVKSDLEDKANVVDVIVTHPTEYKVGSVGLLESEVDNQDGTTTTHWRHQYPIVSYLVHLGVTNYTEYNNSVILDGQNLPILNYVYPERLDANMEAQLDLLPDYLEFYHNLLGEYPYINEKYGHVMWNLNGGMEHATMSSMVNFGRTLTLHELVHQWFGNKITCATWNDIWINEGYAVYFEGVAVEHFAPQDWLNWKRNKINQITSVPNGSVYVPDASLDNVSRIFSSRLSYNKGAMLLNMLRFKIGDTAFFDASRNFLANSNLAYSFASSNDLIPIYEAEYGGSLQEFFNDWLYGEGHPIFDLQLNKQSNGDLVLDVEQTTSHASVDLFETDFQIELIGTNGERDIKRFFLNANSQQFVIDDVNFPIQSYVFNPEANIVATVNSQSLDTQEVNPNLDAIKIYPNPVQDFVFVKNLKHPIQKVTLFDASGKLIQIKTANQNQIQLNLQALPKAVYLLEIESNKEIIVKKIIKQ